MSDEPILEDEVEAEDEVAQRPPLVPSGAEKALKWIIIVAAAVLAGQLALVLIVNPCLPLSHIEVSGVPELDRTFVLGRAGITAKSSYISVNARAAERRLKKLPLVESVHVVKRFPDGVRIMLVGRKAVAMSLVPVDKAVVPAFFDRQGTVFMIGGEGLDENGLRSMPILTGVITEPPFPGMQLSARYAKLFGDLETLRASDPDLLAAFSEIEVSQKAFDAYDLILYPVHSQIRVRLRPSIDADTLRYALLILDVCRSKRYQQGELDFRTGTASYIMR
ncbi:MAG: FtsQ-type POTRA domain-containing protein [Treponema sp.]|jgi:cell division protein FtsQ|nr:FtsQ-type POTRA domain-containing protein [Treponema sp.]